MNLDSWIEITQAVGGKPEMKDEIFSQQQVSDALELILTESSMCEAVHYCIHKKPGHGLLLNVLKRIRPYGAMKECFEIFHTDADYTNKKSAIQLLVELADRRVMGWVPELLAYDDFNIQVLAMNILDKLYEARLVTEDEIVPILKDAETHVNVGVRDAVKKIEYCIWEVLKSREFVNKLERE